MLQARCLHIIRCVSLANCSIRYVITAVGGSQGTHFGERIMLLLLVFCVFPFVIKEWYQSSIYRERWGKLKMSRKEPIKPPRLVIQRILLWLVDVYLLRSTRSLFLGIIYLTNCYWVNFPSSMKKTSASEERSAVRGGVRCMCVVSALPFCYIRCEYFSVKLCLTDTDLKRFT